MRLVAATSGSGAAAALLRALPIEPDDAVRVDAREGDLVFDKAPERVGSAAA